MGSPYKRCSISNFTSRKGGVGKTTLALLKAKAILDANEGEAVKILFFDLDINGTNTIEMVNSLNKMGFWDNKLKEVKHPCENNENSSDKKEIRANIVTLFERYMSGAEFSVKWATEKLSAETFCPSNPEHTLCLFKNKINIIGSFLEKKSTYTPDVLFDQMHSLWLIEMIRSIIRSALNGSAEKLYVIFDNSPGYTGLLPALEDWLTDLGPDICKFYFITTLDGQDFFGAMNSLEKVKGQIQAKTYAVYDYMGAVEEHETKPKEDPPYKHSAFRESKAEEIKDYLEKYDLFYNKLLSLASENIDCPYPTIKTGDSNSRERKDEIHKCQKCNFCYYRQEIAPLFKVFLKETSAYNKNPELEVPELKAPVVSFNIITNKAISSEIARLLYKAYVDEHKPMIETYNIIKLNSEESLSLLYSLSEFSKKYDYTIIKKDQTDVITDFMRQFKDKILPKQVLELREKNDSKSIKPPGVFMKDFHDSVAYYDKTIKDLLSDAGIKSNFDASMQEFSLKAKIQKFINSNHLDSIIIDENSASKLDSTGKPDYNQLSEEIYNQTPNYSRNNISQTLASCLKASVACLSSYSPEKITAKTISDVFLLQIVNFIQEDNSPEIKEMNNSMWFSIHSLVKEKSSQRLRDSGMNIDYEKLETLTTLLNALSRATNDIPFIQIACGKLFQQVTTIDEKIFILRTLHSMLEFESFYEGKTAAEVLTQLYEAFEKDNPTTLSISLSLKNMQNSLCGKAVNMEWTA
ncbi:hypothetical protein SAMN05660337_0476 [Maridesulfovibrio ferrireducens]|uniref:AAA domain-containing protein n=1 Tax=Maridesulfovibrio ferrireducens TaxID=246191 RepID=A0A1G9BZ18_9BACT|nr:hypothetical protein [Maridesulfovibrio ferrireducens]SDK44716.1 hypothetical protein SAMN05660337_0476 [Maridesulfovibrio ferrireducens]